MEFHEKRCGVIISFIGHSTVCASDRIKEIVKGQLRNHIAVAECITCYLGGYGDFDKICACVCSELKQEYIGIERVYVTPYIDLSAQERIKEMQQRGLYDASLYPPIENTPPKLAILKRNEWMVTNADIIIAYVDHNYGGAYTSLKIAKRQKKEIINIYDLLMKSSSN